MTSIHLHPTAPIRSPFVAAAALDNPPPGGYLERINATSAPVFVPVEMRSDEAAMKRVLKLGAVIGIPLVFLVTAAIGYLGGAGLGPSALIGLWSGFWGNEIYLGGIFFLPRAGEDSSPSIRSSHAAAPSPAGDEMAVTANQDVAGR